MPEHPPARSTRFSALLDRMTEGFLAVDEDWRIVECNGPAAAVLGTDREAVLGEDLWERCPGLEDSPIADQYRTAMTERSSTAFEAYFPPGDGRYRLRVFPTADGGLEIYLREAATPDEAGRASTPHAAVLEALTDGVFAVDANDRIVLANDALTAVLDARRGTVLGTHLEALSTTTKLTAEDVRALREGIAHVREGADDHRLQLELPDPEGRPGVVEVRFSPLPGEDRRVAAVLRDVTERRDRERIVRALHAATRELFRAEDPIDACAAAVHTGADLLDLQISGIWLLNEERNRLEPVAATAGAHETVGGLPVFGDGEGIAWRAYQENEAREYADVREAEHVYNDDTPIRSELIVPIGNHGVLMAGDVEVDAFDDVDLELAEILAANSEAVLDRLRREELLEERAEELERQNERLASLEGVLAGPIDATLDEIETTFESGTIEEARQAVARARALVDVAATYANRPDASGARTGLTLGETLETTTRSLEGEIPTPVITNDGTLRADQDLLEQLLAAIVRNAGERDAGAVSVGVLQATGSRARRLSGFYLEDDGDVIPRRVREPPFDPYAGAVRVGLELELARLLARDHGWELEATPTQHGMRFEITEVTTLSPTKE